MLTRNLTPFLFAAKVCSRRPPQLEMTLIVRGTFALRPGEEVDQGSLTAEVFHPDDDERQGECVYGGDFADFKLNAEALLKGTCHAPGGKPAATCPVLFRVGAWSKVLRVVGDRVFTDKVFGAAVSEPEPFTSMPLSWANAFGGPGYADNPVGKGYKTRELPNVERPGDVISARSDHPAPAGFGPISPYWPERERKRGKEYGRSYLAERAPFYATDFDWTYFNAAPPDQWMQGYLAGDEELSFQNLHSTVPILTARLPGLRIRAFVKDDTGAVGEARMLLDTLFADLDAGTVTLTWRGLTPVREDDLDDIRTVLIASEPLAEPPRPEAHYVEALEAFERDPVGLKDAFPPGLEALGEQYRRERAGEPPVETKVPEELDPVSALMRRRLGDVARPEQDKLREAMKQILATAEGQDLDLQAQVDKLEQQAADIPPTPKPARPGAFPNLGLRRLMRRILAEVEELKKKLADPGLRAEDRARLEQKIEEIEALPRDERWKQIDPGYTPPEGPVSTDEPGPGRDLSEQDLTGRDLHGQDLTGANLEDTILTRANLAGANLAGANLRNAILFKADLSGADLSGADLTRANLATVRAAGAKLRGAVIEEAFFEHAKLMDADLSEARGAYAVLTRADLTGATLRGAALDHIQLDEATIERADLGQASLVSGVFASCRGASANLTDADVSGATFAGADLTGAALVGCRGKQAIWHDARLDGADLSFATLVRGHFTKASAVGASFFGANLRDCRFYRATLDDAEIVRANLFAADLCKARLSGTKFTGSSLYEAKFIRASGAGTDFTDANLKRSTLERS